VPRSSRPHGDERDCRSVGTVAVAWNHAPWSQAYQKAESLHFITFSCFHRFPLLETSRPKDIFEVILEQARARHQARIYAFVLMPEHVHLLINEPPSTVLAQFLKAVKQTSSRRLKSGRERFWQDRYFDRNIEA